MSKAGKDQGEEALVEGKCHCAMPDCGGNWTRCKHCDKCHLVLATVSERDCGYNEATPGVGEGAVAELTSFQQAILKAVNRSTGAPRSGFVVCDIAFLVGRQPGHQSNRAHSALVSRECRTLERAGLLCRLDDKTPIVWCIADGVPPSHAVQEV